MGEVSHAVSLIGAQKGEDMIGEATRPWREIARELVHTIDPKKVIALREELDHALEEEGLVLKSQEPEPPKSA